MKEAFEKIKERLEKLKGYEANGDCPKDGMCTKKPYECTSCYSSTAIEIVNQVENEYNNEQNKGMNACISWELPDAYKE